MGMLPKLVFVHEERDCEDNFDRTARTAEMKTQDAFENKEGTTTKEGTAGTTL